MRETFWQYIGSLVSEEERKERLRQFVEDGCVILEVRQIAPTVQDGRPPALLVHLSREVKRWK